MRLDGLVRGVGGLRVEDADERSTRCVVVEGKLETHQYALSADSHLPHWYLSPEGGYGGG